MIIFLYGEDSFRSRKKLNELKGKFLREVDPTGADLIGLDGEKIKISKINDAIGPAALFSRKKMIIIENIFLNKDLAIFKELLALIKSKSDSADSNIIIFIDEISEKEKLAKDKSALFKFLAEQKFSQGYRPMNNAEITAWAKNLLQTEQMRISHDGMQLLLSITGTNLWLINNELNKLINYKKSIYKAKAGELTPIDADDIKLLVQMAYDENIFAFTDALSNKNKRQAVKIFEEQLLAGSAEGYLLNMILRQYKILLQIREALDNGFSSRKIMSELKLHPFVAQKGILQARNYNSAELKKLLKKLIHIDYSMKSGQTNVKNELSMLISSL